MFGHFYLEDKRGGTQMHYTCLFTCLVTRTVHFEVCHELSNSCLLMAIRRFVSKLGYPDLIVSDNGKTFLGANKSLKLRFLRKYQRDERLHQTAIGATEHSVGFQPTIGSTLRRSLREADTDREEESTNCAGQSELGFQTVVAEGEAILNIMPLTSVSCSISDDEPLTPIHFLLRRFHMSLKHLVNNNQRFITKDFKLRSHYLVTTAAGC